MDSTRKQCIELLKKYEISETKLVHTLLVEKVSLMIGQEFLKNKVKVDLDLVSKGALLHDIGKLEQKKTGICHAIAGYKICLNEKIDEPICLIVKNHVLEKILETPFNNWEEKIVFYADKICGQDIVSINKRFDRFYELMPEQKKLFDEGKILTKKLEKEIFKKSGLSLKKIKDKNKK